MEIIMNNRKYMQKIICGIILGTSLLAGCSKQMPNDDKIIEETQVEEIQTKENINSVQTTIETTNENEEILPEVVEADREEYFNGLNGAAVVYDTSSKKCMIYNNELAMTASYLSHE